MKKLLYILNIAKRVNNFSYTAMIAAQKLGWEFHIAGNWSYASEEERLADERRYGIKIHQIDFIRAPYHPGNRRAYAQLKELVKKEKYDMIHCNTPIGGVLGRLVAKKCKTEKVIYQVHGFHFYKGAPKRNWMLYYPVEKWLARYTDVLITINREDYEFAKRRLKLRGEGEIHYVPGVGIDTSQYGVEDGIREQKRKELGLPEDAVVLISVGELNENKNNTVILAAMEKLKRKNVHYVLCGAGDREEALRKQADAAGLGGNVHFLGYRSDVKELLGMADVFVMPSFREGLSRSIMEAMASGLPVVASRIRGNTDLVADEGGRHFDPHSSEDCLRALTEVLEGDRAAMGEYNVRRVADFGEGPVFARMREIYEMGAKEHVQ